MVTPKIYTGCEPDLKINVEDFNKIKAGVCEEDIYTVEKHGSNRNARKWIKE